MSLAALLQRVVDVLADAGVPHMLTESLAATYYSVPRATQDVAVVVAPTEGGILRVVTALPSDRQTGMGEAVRRPTTSREGGR